MAPDGSQPLHVELDEVGGFVVVRPIGEVDIASVSILQEVLNRCFEDGSTRLVVSLEGLDYLDSTGLGCVTAARRRSQDAGGDLVLVCTRDRILRLFTITGLDQVFTICRTVEAAVERLGRVGG